MSTARSPRKTVSPPQAAKEDLTTCNICKRYIQAARDGLQCKWCKCRVHVACVPELLTAKEEEINRIRSSKTSLFYACTDCSARVNKESDSSNFFDFNAQLAGSEKKNRAEILRLKRELEAAQEINQRDNAALQDLQNEQKRLLAEREQLVRVDDRKSKKRRNTDMNATIMDTSDTDATDDNYDEYKKLSAKLHLTVDNIKKELGAQFQLAIATLTEKFIEMIERNNNTLRNELFNQPSTSAAAKQQDLLMDSFPQLPVKQTNFNLPQPLIPADQYNLPVPTQQIQNPNRTRSQSRPRQLTQQPKINATFAAVLTRSKEKPESIRNIRTTGSDEERALTIAALQRETACITNRIKSIKSKGNYNMTIKCDSPDEAEKIEKTLIEKYGEKIEVNEVRKIKPQIKITGVLCDENIDHDELIQSIRLQNYWLRESEFSIDRVYSIQT